MFDDDRLHSSRLVYTTFGSKQDRAGKEGAQGHCGRQQTGRQAVGELVAARHENGVLQLLPIGPEVGL